MLKLYALKWTVAIAAASVVSSGCAVSFREPIAENSSSNSVAEATSSGELNTSLPISGGISVYDFGTKASSSQSEIAITLTNSGASAITLGEITNATLGLASSAFSLSGGTCSSATVLQSNATCTLSVTFSPAATGSVSITASLPFSDPSGNRALSIALSGIAASPASLSVAGGPSAYDFGTVANTSSSNYTFTVTNSGGVAATLGTISSSGVGLATPYSLSGGTCASGVSVAAAGSCTLVVSYSPTAIGATADTIDVIYHNGVSPSQSASRGVQGTSVNAAVFTLSDASSYDFGSVTTSTTVTHTFTVTNSGGAVGTLGTISTAGIGLASPFSLTGGTCASSGTLTASGGTCTLIVTFSPSSAVLSSDSIDVAYNDGFNSQTSSRSISGTGITPASLALSGGPGSYDYGSATVGTNNDITFTVTNSGATNATLGTISTAGLALAAPYSLSSGTCSTGGTVTANGGTCTLVVRFSPSGTGVASDSIDVSYNNGVSAGQTASRGVTGTGISAASLAVSDGPGSYDYGSQINTTNTDKTFTVTNSGATNATLGTISTAGLGLAAPYSYVSGSCSTSGVLNAGGGTCTIVVRFTPSSAGAASDSIDVGYNDGVSAQTASRGVTGTGVTVASLALSDGPGNYDYGTQTNGSNTDKTFTLTNSGGTNATLGTISTAGLGLAAPYTYQSGTCSSSGSLASGGGTCTIVVRFSPSSAGAASDSIDVSYNDGLSAQTASRGVTGTGAAAAVYTTSAVTGTGYINTNISVTLSYTPGGTPTSCSTSGASGGSVSSCTCASGSCVVVFAPTANLSGTAAASFNYTVYDGTTNSNSSAATININTFANATAAQVQADAQAVAAAGSPSPIAYTTYASPAPNNTYGAWTGGVLYYNTTSSKSFIYGIPSASSRILKVDIATGAQSGIDVTALKNGGGSDWFGGILAQNGMIYMAPNYNAQKFLKLDPTSDTASLLSTSYGSTGNDTFRGMVMAGDGSAYALPYDSNQVVKLVPSTDTTSNVGSPMPASTQFEGGALAFDGKIYASSKTNTRLLTIDPNAADATKTSVSNCSAFGCDDHTHFILAPNGNLYAGPGCSDTVLKYVPSTSTMTTLTTTNLSGNGFCGKVNSGALGNDGKVYFMPHGSWGSGGTLGYVIVVDPTSDTVSLIDMSSVGTNNWGHRWGLVSAPDGNLYGMPYTVSTVLKVSPNGRSNFNLQTLLSPFFNHF